MLSRLLVSLMVINVVRSAAFGADGSRISADPQPSRLSLAVFDVDATPPIGSMMAYDPVTNKWDLGLRARGVVLLGAGQPIVLCAVDWIGIANDAYDTFRAGLAQAAGTIPARVALHALEQRGGFETLGEPELTTMSGRQAQMRATQVVTVIIDFNFQQGQGGVQQNTGGATQ